MAEAQSSHYAVDPKSGFCAQTRISHSLRPVVALPPPHQPLSITHYTFSLLRATLPPSAASSTTVLIDAASGRGLSYAHFLSSISALTAALRSRHTLFPGDTALILAPTSFHVPIIYFSLLSLGVVISPANPLSSASEIAHIVSLCRPAVVFTTRAIAPKLGSFSIETIIIDSHEFQSIVNLSTGLNNLRDYEDNINERIDVKQYDSAAILYSSGTTGRVKGVLLTHRNLIAVIAGFFYNRAARPEDWPEPVSLFTLPLFHIFGFFMLVRAMSMGETMVLMERFDFEGMLKAVEKYRVMYMPVSPPLVVAMTKSDLVKKYDLSSLRVLGCGGAPLGREVADSFTARFPNVEISEGYGLTESGGTATRMVGLDEAKRHGSTGRLAENMEAKIVDPATGEALLPGQQGELWLRGPSIMKGYVGDDAATSATLDPEGWLKTGDLCYFDSEGFLFIIDRLKELIKYKGYQVPPAELEHILQSNPEIADCAVIPYPDEEVGQIPMAFVVRKPGSSITDTQVMEFVAKQVAPYKKIRRVAFINSIPKSPAGKILRKELVTHALSGASSRL